MTASASSPPSREGFLKQGKIALWRKTPEAGSRQPHFSGVITLENGVTISVSLWEQESDNPLAPVLKGQLSKKQG